MESETEALRLDLKTDSAVVEEQARWAGIAPGMRVLDLGCGAGRTTHILHQMVQPGGEVVGIDWAQARIDYAIRNYSGKSICYLVNDARRPLGDLGSFDLVWVRFLLEYYEGPAYQIAKNAYDQLAPGGTLCLIDLDQNCLGHFGGPDRLNRTMHKLVLAMQKRFGFDPFVGRKLYAYLCDLGCADIQARMSAHHLIYGELSEADRFNWQSKAEVGRKVPELFAEDYPGGYEEFRNEFAAYLEDARRFIYTPLILCKGKKPAK